MTDREGPSGTGSSAPPPADPSETLPRGTSVGRYVILDVIGHGGMGVVYSAFDAQLDRKLAIKVIRDDRLRKTPDISARLLREAQAMARLTHPNVVSIYDVGTYGERVFLAMEYVQGCTLREWLRTKPSWHARLEVLLSAGEGLAAAHDAGVVHRDFKPDNVLIGQDKRVLVTDFGLAREADTGGCPSLVPPADMDGSGMSELPPSLLPPKGERDVPSLTPFGTPLTNAGNILGTVGFMAPEQVYRKNATFATDQFSYAVTAYFVLYGQLPFPGDRVRAYLRSMYRVKLEQPRNSDVPSWVHKTLVQGLCRKPEGRFASMRELLDALRRDPQVALRNRIRFAIGAVLLLAATLVIWSALVERRQICAVPSNEWTGVWDDPVRAEIRSAFGAADPAQGAATFERARVGISSYVAEWNAMQAQSCAATRIHRSQPEDLYRLRADCLLRRKEELTSVTRLMRNADRQVVDKGIALAYGLDSISWCADVAALRSSSGLPDDPDKRVKVQELRGRVADLQSIFSAGKYKAVAEDGFKIAGQASELGDPSTRAQGLYFAGHANVRLGDLAAARKLFFDSIFFAVEAGDNATAARSALGISYIVGAKERLPAEGRHWLELARAFVKRMGGNAEYTAWLNDTEGSIAADGEGDVERGTVLQEMAYDTYKQTFGLVHPRTQLSLMNLALDHAAVGHFEKAQALFQQAAVVAEALYGPSSIEAFRIAAELGHCDTSLGSLGRGEQELLHGLAGVEAANDGLAAAEALGWLVNNATLRGDTSHAVGLARRALASLGNIDSLPSLVPVVMVPSGRALLLANGAEEAVRLCDRALSLQEGAGPIPFDQPYGWDALTCKAEALIALERNTEAIPLLERALVLHRRVFVGDYARSEFALARALFAGHGEGPRASSLAKKARDEFAKTPFLSRELGEVNAWLAKRGLGF